MSTRSLVERYLDAVNTHDWATLVAVFHPDVTIQHGMTLSTSGRDKAIRLLTAVVAQFAEHEDRPTRFIVEGDSAAVEITFVGTLPDGTEITFPAADVIDTDGERITRVVSWYDTAAVVPQIRKES
ncbi:MAG TPA: nuclear transport factor 2 family protein [Nocardioides sp.]|uniref:nuclear transport factor 2 family protein n=1 Tax=Nocardioides sp. TaxID=35761 RepID=UPI002C093B02|nr:nuclear transport factor 2 family protein [Nocardioides sp.]HTW17469.1 nuclear transport factor 2 family protein [Nocardioides sp.]